MTQDYYGTKRVTAWPARGQEGDHGYAVKYADGYISWSPIEPFEAAYQPLDALSFGHALVALKEGKRLKRKAWVDSFIFLVAGSKFQVNRAPLPQFYAEGTEICYNAHIDVRLADGSVAVWGPSQVDMLADDWTIVE